MQIRFDELSSMIQALTLEDDKARISQLQDIKTLLIASPSATTFNGAVRASDITNLFTSLSSDNEEEVEIACDVISRSLPMLEAGEVLTELSSYLQAGLVHENKKVQELVITELTRMMKDSSCISSLIESPGIIGCILDVVGNDEATVATSAKKFLSSFGRTSVRGAKLLLNTSADSLLSRMLIVMQRGDVVRFRVYEIVCDIGSSSEETLSVCINSGVLNRFFQECKGNDILTKVTCCTMLSEFINAPHVLNYLVQSGVVSDMAESIKNSSSDPFASIYLPGVIKFFGKICIHNGPRFIIEIFSEFVPVVIQMLLHSQDMKQVAIETIGVVGKTAEGKVVLSEQVKMRDVIQELCKMTSHSENQMRIIAIEAISNIFDHSQVEPEALKHIESLTVDWFQLLLAHRNPIEFVVAICKQPFPQVKIAGYVLVRSTTLVFVLSLSYTQVIILPKNL